MDGTPDQNTASSGRRYPVLSRIPEVPGLLADAVAERLGPDMDRLFRKRSDGALEFYPWRIGTGYLVSDPERQDYVRHSVRRFAVLAHAGFLGLETVLTFQTEPTGLVGAVKNGFAVGFGLVALVLAAYGAWAWHLTQGCPRTEGRRTLRGVLRQAAEATSASWLWLGEGIVLGLAGLGVVLVLREALVAGILCTAFFGTLALTRGYQLWWTFSPNEEERCSVEESPTKRTGSFQ